MSAITGGVATAAGLGFQYLAAIDALLTALEAGDDNFTLTTEDATDDAIDYSLRDGGGKLVIVAQAKAAVEGEEGANITPGEMIEIGARLVKTESQRHIIRTNRRPSPGTIRLLSRLRENPLLKESSIDSAREALASTLGVTAQKTIASLSSEEIRRFWQLELSLQPDGVGEMRRDIKERIVSFRRRTTGGIGPATSSILLGYIVAEFLHRSGRKTDRHFDRAEAISLLGVPPSALAQAAGRYEWGQPIGPIPAGTTIHRPAELDQISEILSGLPVDRMSRRVVLTGLSGVGKSTLARQFGSVMSERYDWIVWLDASSDAALRQQAERLLGQTPENMTNTEVAAMFCTFIGQSVATWLIVYDNVVSSAAIRDWVPSIGHADVIATSTDATAWVQWPAVYVPPLQLDEAVDLVALRLNLTNLNDHDQQRAAELVEHLGKWPLAIELACAFLFSSGRGLSLTDEYLNRLESRIIDDTRLVPAAYRSHPSLLQAILVALDSLDESSGRDLDGSAMLDALSYLPPRSAPLKLVALVAACAHQALLSRPFEEFSYPSEFEMDEAVHQLSTSSLVRRIPAADADLLGDQVAANEIVLNVVRELQAALTQQAILEMSQVVVGNLIVNSSDKRRFAAVGAALPSALSILRFAQDTGHLTGDGITLIGNIALYWSARGEYGLARDTYRREIAALDNREASAPRLRAKIYAGLATALLHLNSPFDEIEETVTLAMDAIRRADSRPRNDRELSAVVDNLGQILLTLEPNAASNDGSRIGKLYMRLRKVAGGHIADTYRSREISALLSSNEGDLEALLLIEEQLKLELPDEIRLQFLGNRAEALVALHLYAESLNTFVAANEYAEHLGLDAGTIRTSVLNAWMLAAIGLLSSGEPSDEYEFCLAMKERFEGMPPGTASDRDRLALCLAMTASERGPFDSAKEMVDALDRIDLSSTHLAQDSGVKYAAVQACKDIIQIRTQCEGALLAPMRSWASGPRPNLSEGTAPIIEIGLTPKAWAITGLAGAVDLIASWVENSLGVGLLVKGSPNVVIWANESDTRWLRLPGAGTQLGTQRLRNVMQSLSMRKVVIGPLKSLAPGIVPEIKASDAVTAFFG